MVTLMFPDMSPAIGAILGMGGSCFVSYVDEATVHKSYEIWVNGRRRSYCPEGCEDDLTREDAVYKHLGQHDHILRCFGLDEIHHPGVHALRLELAPLGTVRDFIQKKQPDNPLSEPTRVEMCRDAAAGIAHIHSRRVWHSDISCRNLMFFDDYRVKIGDFGGSIIEGCDSFPVTVAEEQQYELPCRGRNQDKLPRMKRELFALGSCMYEIMAWKRPFQGLRDSEVRKRYERGEFPCLDGFPAAVAQAVRNCWHEVYDCADEVVELLKEPWSSNGEDAALSRTGK